MNSMTLRWKNGLSHALTLSYDDGLEADVRLIEIMQRNGLKGTFNLNSAMFNEKSGMNGDHRRHLSAEEAKALYLPAGMEVAVHGARHPHWERMPRHACMADILLDRINLEKAFGGVIRGAAYPNGTYSDMTVECLRDAGIAYCRTAASTRAFTVPTDWLRMPTTCHHNDPALFELCDRFLDTPGTKTASKLFYLWGHSYEFGDRDNWNVIEAFAEKMGRREDIYYATNIEIYDYVEAYRQLHFSCDLTYVENPTAKTVWFAIDGKTYEVGAGKAISL